MRRQIILYIICLAVISALLIFRSYFPRGGAGGDMAVIVRPQELERTASEPDGDLLPQATGRELAAVKNASESINSFAFDMYEKLSAGTHVNAFFSFSGMPERFAAQCAGDGAGTLGKWAGECVGTSVTTGAAYLRPEWNYEIPDNTRRRAFYAADGTSPDVDMAHMRGDADYCETEMFQSVRMPYKTRAYSMIVMLPREKDDLGRQLLSRELFDSVSASYERTDVDLYLPRFVEYVQFDLAWPMQPDMPAQAGDWRPKRGAAAVIAVTSGYDRPAPKLFRADHTFLYFVVENRTNAILFMGRYSGPR